MNMKQNRQIKAVVFDVDGTLVNTRELILKAYAHVAGEHGLAPPTEAAVMEHMGKALEEIYLGLFPDHDPAILVRSNDAYVLQHAHTVQAHAGMKDVLQGLAAQGIKLAALTGGSAKVHEVLRHHDIEDMFDSIVHSERITKQKPDPEGLRLALKECGVSPADTIMVGDMRYDILAGKNTGVLATVGLTHGFGTLEELEHAGADYIIDSLLALQGVIDTIKQV